MKQTIGPRLVLSSPRYVVRTNVREDKLKGYKIFDTFLQEFVGPHMRNETMVDRAARHLNRDYETR